MTTSENTSELEFAALLCSRVCHDVIGPVGAVINGLEVLDDDEDEEMRKIAFDLIRKSARQASAKLQLCRLAFGAAGSAGAELDLGDAETVLRGFVEDANITIEWSVPHETRPKNQVKLLLNLVLIALSGIPRGGILTVTVGPDVMSVKAQGEGAKVTREVADMMAGEIPEHGLDARSIQLQYSLDLARTQGLELAVDGHEGFIEVNARPRTVAAA